LFSKSFPRLMFAATGLLASLLLTACGGGNGCSNNCGADTGDAFPIADPDLNTLPPSSTFANICTAGHEKAFVLTYMNENYLLYSRMVPPSAEQTALLDVDSYFAALLTSFPPSGNLPSTHPYDDRYSYVIPTYLANSLDTGYSPGGYGFSWVTDRDGKQRVTYVAPNSPAAAAGMARGGEITSGGEFDSPGLHPYTANGMYPYTVNAGTTFTYRDVPGGETRAVMLTAVPFQEDPVPIVSIMTSGNRKVGYMLFLNHSSISQDKLIDSIAYLRGQGVKDLVLDLRYNEGGFVYAAQSLASMIAGSNATTGFADNGVFERQIYNGKVPDVTLPFLTKVTWVPGISSLPPGYNNNTNKARYAAGTALPALNLGRVYVLTSNLTASSSEALINALRGVDVNVVQIGTLTYGNPYGSNRRDNCGEAFYPIQYQGFNAKNFGDYAVGLTPTCLVHDDFGYPLGNQNEALLNAALGHIATGQCPGSITQN